MEERGAAPIVGIVLLIGLVLAGGISLFAVGSVALDSVQSDVQVDQAETALVQYADSVQTGQSASLSLPDAGTTDVSSDSSVQIKVGSDEVVNTTLGTVIYEEDGNQRVFEGGAVFSKNTGEPSIVSQPPISYQYDAEEQHQTLTMDVVTVDGTADDLETGNAFEGASSGESVVSGSYNETVTITIQSQYAQAWATYFEESTHALVNFDASTNTVSATLPVVQPTAVENSFTVDGSIGLGGGVGVSSYDSRTAPNQGSVGTGNYKELAGGDVVSTGGFEGTGSAKVDGNLYVDDDFSFTGGTEVSGDIYATGNVTIKSSTPIESRIVAGGDIIIANGGVNFAHGSVVRAGGDLLQQSSAEYAGKVHVGGDIVQTDSTNYDSSAEFLAAGSVSFVDNPEEAGATVTENADDPVLTELDRIDEMVNSIPNPAERVADAQTKYAGAPTVELGGDDANDHLTAGNYRVSGDVVYGWGPSITFDTTDGEINLLVEGDFIADNIDAEVIGNNQVNLYVTGNFKTEGDPDWSNPDGAGNRLIVYTASETETTKVQSSNGFYGVIFSESDLELGGGTSVYGAIVMNGSDVNGGQNVYFDEALEGTDLSNDNTGPQNAEKTYLHISRVTA